MALSPSDEEAFTRFIDNILAEGDLNTISAGRIRKQLQQTLNRDLTPQKTALNDLIRERFNRQYDEQQSQTNGHSLTTNGESHSPHKDNPQDSSNSARDAIDTPSESPAPGQKRPAEDDVSEGSGGAAASSKSTPKKKQVKVVDEDAAFAARLQAEENRRGRSTRGGNVKKPPISKKKMVSRKKKSSTKIKGEDGSDVDSADEVAEKKVNRNGAFHKPHLLSGPLSAVLDNETQLSRPQTVKRIWGYVREHNLQDQNDKRMIICDEPLRAVFKSDKIHMFTMNKILAQHLYPVDG